MKRDPRLIEFSREHHSALQLGLFLQNSEDSHENNLRINELKAMLLNHFDEEEHDLLEIMDLLQRPQLKEQFLEDHQLLREILQQDYLPLNDTQVLGKLLVKHSHFEERELFTAIQNYWTTNE